MNETTKEFKTRDKIDPQYKWHLQDLFATDDEWRNSFEAVKREAKDLALQQGSLSGITNGANWQDSYGLEQGISGQAKFQQVLSELDVLKTLLDQCFRLYEEFGRIYVYAHMSMHQDTGDTSFQAKASEVDNLKTIVAEATAYIRPEVSALGKKFLENFGARFGEYRQFIDNLIRLRTHILTPEQEQLLAAATQVANAPNTIFLMLNNADMEFGTVKVKMKKDEEAKVIHLTHGNYISLLRTDIHETRRVAFEAYYEPYVKRKNTLAATLASAIQRDVFAARTRKFEAEHPCLSQALSESNIPVSVYFNLISTVHQYLPVFHDYMELRRSVLKSKEFHIYDTHVPLTEYADKDRPYEEAKELVVNALSILGEDYVKNLKSGLESGWIDVYENRGKRSGAYSWGSYGCHPYVLLNYNNKLEDVLTLAHEMGHAMHSFYTWKAQSYVNSNYSIFLAEIASTVNENLLLQHLLKTTEDKQTKLLLLNYFLEEFKNTLFRQTMFAEFELKTHEIAEKDGALTVDVFNKIYHDLNSQYFGPNIILDAQSDIEWSRIPHFYNQFYVYQYATGFSAAIGLSKNILANNTKSIKAYQRFLKYGASYYPMDIIRWAGVDMRTPKAITDALEYFKTLLKETKELMQTV
jgi:oligoendopeptidase F